MPKWISRNWFGILFVLVLGGATFYGYPELRRWMASEACKSDSATAACAAWVQAVGSVAAIVVALLIAWYQQFSSDRREQQSENAKGVALAMLAIPRLRYYLDEIEALQRYKEEDWFDPGTPRVTKARSLAARGFRRLGVNARLREIASQMTNVGPPGLALQGFLVRLDEIAQFLHKQDLFLEKYVDSNLSSDTPDVHEAVDEVYRHVKIAFKTAANGPQVLRDIVAVAIGR